MNSYVLCVRNIKNEDNEKVFGNSVGSLSYLEIPEGDGIPNPKHDAGTALQWLAKIRDKALSDAPALQNNLDVVFFVHGYNTTSEESLTRQRLVERELNNNGFRCIVVGFDWPSNDNPVDYLSDRYDALNTAPLLVKGGIIPFTKFTMKDCPVKVSVMAHSMGAFVVREAFRNIDKFRDTELNNDWKVGQIVFFAADISSDSFKLYESDMLAVFNHCGRLTNYYSGYDEALAASNIKNGDFDSRVGRVGMPDDVPISNKAVDVDCGPRYKSEPVRNLVEIKGLISHSWYLEDEVWFKDLAQTLKGDVDRNVINTRNTKIGSNDFVLNVK